MKRLYPLFALLVLMFVVGCASTAETEEEPLGPGYRVIENKNTTLGGSIPEWVTTDAFDLEANNPAFENKYVIIIDRFGPDLNALRFNSNIDALSAITQVISTRFQEKLVQAVVADQEDLTSYTESVRKLLAEAQLSRFENKGDFWVKLQWDEDAPADKEPGQIEFRFLALYSIDRDILDSFVEDAIEETEAPTEAQQRTKDLVREAFEGGL